MDDAALARAAFLVASEHAFEVMENDRALASVEAEFKGLKRATEIINRSALGGVPVYRPEGVDGDMLPLLDITDEGTMRALERETGVDLPTRIDRPVTGRIAKALEQAIEHYPGAEIAPDAEAALQGVSSLFSHNLQAQARSGGQKAKTSAATKIPPLHVDLEVETNHPNLNLFYWPLYVTKLDRSFGWVGTSLKARRIIPCGIYLFQTRDSSGALLDQEPRTHNCNPRTTPVKMMKL